VTGEYLLDHVEKTLDRYIEDPTGISSEEAFDIVTDLRLLRARVGLVTRRAEDLHTLVKLRERLLK
jgi:hypothetical protein